jgi:hypothetical protein
LKNGDIIQYQLVKTNRRLTFDILWQREDTMYQGPDDGDYFVFVASNGYQVISRSRMDIQTERLWLLGAQPNERSGSMVFSSNTKRDRACTEFLKALDEWCKCVRAGEFGPRPTRYYLKAQFLGNDDNPAVDLKPLVYMAARADEVTFLRRVLECKADDEAQWLLGNAQPLTDFARLGEPLSIEAVRELHVAQSGYRLTA